MGGVVFMRGIVRGGGALGEAGRVWENDGTGR